MAVRTLRELALFTFYLIVAIVLTWPLAANLPTAVSDLGDPLLNAWILDWDCYALTHQPLQLFDASIFYPAKFPLAYSEHLVGVALLVLPFWLAGLGAITIHNIALLLGFALSAYGASVLARVVTRRFMPSALAGILYGFVPYRLGQLPHLQVISGAWLPLLLAALLVYRRSPTIRNAILFGAAFVMNGLTNVYYLLFATVAMVLTMALIAIAERHDRRFWLRMASTMAISMALLLPFLVPYKVVSEKYGMKRGDGESMGASATWNDWLIAPRQNALYGRLPSDEDQHSERQLFPGALMLFLTATAFLVTPRRERTHAAVVPSAALRTGGGAPRWLDAIIVLLALLTFFGAVTREIHIVWHGRVLLDFGRSYLPATLLVVCVMARFAIRFPAAISDGNLRTAIANSRFSFELWATALWIAIGVIGALGMHLFFHSFLFHFMPGFRAIRVPARWAVVAYTGLAVWAAAGATLLARRRWLMPIFFALALVEVWPRIRWEHALVEPSPVDRWLAQTHAGPLLELPVNRINVLYLYLLRATAHHVPIFDGISGFEPPLHYVLREQPLSDATFTLLERNGCRFILVRPEWFGWQWPQALGWVRRGLDQGHLVFLRRFDGGITGDWLFAMPHIEKQWQRYRAPSDDVQLARLLEGKTTYNSSTFGQLYQPKMRSEITGPMTVSGWALSPRGIRNVIVRVDNGRFRIAAGLFKRDDVTQLYPWYPQTPLPAFATTIPRRPRGVPEETDVQVEIIDGAGHRTMLPDVLVAWR
ncbi:MAG TPA: hypothetical protein VER58_09425 [Thermoanaerobaculia bacterium]|nr:hypothetical protein [Thermoanaerobaculia bacterium]